MTRKLPKELRSSLIRAAVAVGATLLFGPAAQAADPIKVGVTIAMSPPGSVVQGTQVRDGSNSSTRIRKVSPRRRGRRSRN